MQHSSIVNPSWYIIWGNVNQEPKGCTFFVPHQIAIAHIQPSFSTNQQFLVVGDIWLTHPPRNRFTTDLDLVASLLETHGLDCINQLQGIFSLVIWQQDTNQLWLIRDRSGGKTLYYTTNNNIYYIAPRLKTLSGWHSHNIDIIALRDYLCCAFVPGERTLWQQVKEIRPGTILSLPQQKIDIYWQPQEQIIPAPQQWHSHRLRSLLEQITLEYLPHNQPVGVYLSGGLDSSCVTALAAKFHNQSVHTYSIHFGSECPNELEFSSLVAKHCQTQHHILEITTQQMWEQLFITMANLDDPIGDPLTVPNYLLAQLAKQDVKVILNGEGGDPCFGGPKNQPMLLNQLYQQTPDLVATYLNSFQKCASDLPRLLKPDIFKAIQQPSIFAPDLSTEAKYLNRLMILNIKYKGADHILTKVNNLTRAANLEGRSPLFDQRIVQLSMEIPPEYKLTNAEEKAILKEAVFDLLPLEIIQRPKSGMMVPVQLWFRKYWHKKARNLLLNKKAAIAPYFNQDVIRDWLNYRGDTWNRYGVKLWLLVSLEQWLQANFYSKDK